MVLFYVLTAIIHRIDMSCTERERKHRQRERDRQTHTKIVSCLKYPKMHFGSYNFEF